MGTKAQELDSTALCIKYLMFVDYWMCTDPLKSLKIKKTIGKLSGSDSEVIWETGSLWKPRVCDGLGSNLFQEQLVLEKLNFED